MHGVPKDLALTPRTEEHSGTVDLGGLGPYNVTPPCVIHRRSRTKYFTPWGEFHQDMMGMHLDPLAGMLWYYYLTIPIDTNQLLLLVQPQYQILMQFSHQILPQYFVHQRYV
jgi:hypothetical protein